VGVESYSRRLEEIMAYPAGQIEAEKSFSMLTNVGTVLSSARVALAPHARP
jgi:hypothetical protein